MRRVFILIFLILFVSLSCFLGCNARMEMQEEKHVTVAFSPVADKAVDFGDYHWQYCCTYDDPERADVVWKDFDEGLETGIGEVKFLEPGCEYYFGLRGYSIGENPKLMWEGYHCQTYEDARLPVRVSLDSNNVLMTVDLSPGT